MRIFLSFIFAAWFILTPQLAQAADDDDLIILDEDSQPQADSNQILDFLQRHFQISGGGFYAGGGSAFEQGFGFGSAGFDYPFTFFSRRGRIFVEGGYSYREVELTLSFEESFPNVGNDQARIEARRDELEATDSDCAPVNPDDVEISTFRRTCEFNIKVTDSSGELREAFLEYEVFPDVVVAVGRQRPVWGQFDVFSVTNALLPIEVQTRQFGFSNNNLRFPQDAVIVSYFPTERIELSGYLFLQTSLDPLLEEGLRGGNYNLLRDTDLVDTDLVACDEVQDLSGVSDCEFEIGGDLAGEDRLGYAARALWRTDYATIGFTFNQGRYSLLGTFNRLPIVSRFCRDGLDCGDDANLIGYNVQDRLILGESRSFGFEISIPLREWTIKGEFVYNQSQTDIGVFTQRRRQCPPQNPVNDCQPFDAFFNWIVRDNRGRGYVDVDAIMVQLGFDARYDRWNFGLSILLFQSLLSGEADRANDLYKAAFPGNDSQLDEGDFDGIPLPTVYVFYDFGLEKEHTVGLAGGFLGIVAGVSVFYTGSKLFNEHLNWTAAVDYTTSLASQLIADSNDNRQGNEGSTELSEEFSLTFRVGATLEF